MGHHPQIRARAGPNAPPPQRRSVHAPPASVHSRLKFIAILTLGRHALVSPPFHPRGMPACSRWLSEAIPPESSLSDSRTPAGVSAIDLRARPPFVSSHSTADLFMRTESRCDSVCLRSRHFVAWLRRGPAHDAIANASLN